MAWELPSFKLPGFTAEADLSAAQFLGVNGGTAAGQVALAGAGEAIFGVLQNKPTAGQAAEVMNKGVTKGISGAAILVHVQVEVDAAGKFITLAAGVPVGFALEAAGAADEIITVLLV